MKRANRVLFLSLACSLCHIIPLAADSWVDRIWSWVSPEMWEKNHQQNQSDHPKRRAIEETIVHHPVELTLLNQATIDDRVYMAILGCRAGEETFYHVDAMGSVLPVLEGETLDQYFFDIDHLSHPYPLPKLDEGMIYFSIGKPLTSQPVDFLQGLILPDPKDPQDPCFLTIYDTLHFTYRDDGLEVNPAPYTFSFPIAVTVIGDEKGTQHVGRLISSRRHIFEALEVLSDAFSLQVVKGGNYHWTHHIRVIALPPSMADSKRERRGQSTLGVDALIIRDAKPHMLQIELQYAH